VQDEHVQFSATDARYELSYIHSESQTAAPNGRAMLTQCNCMQGGRIPCAKVVGATSSEGFLVIPRKRGNTLVCVSVCLSVTTITKQIVDGFVPNFMGRFLSEREDQVRVSLRSVEGCGSNGQKTP